MSGKYSLFAAAVLASPLLALPLLPAEATAQHAPVQRPAGQTARVVDTVVAGPGATTVGRHVRVALASAQR